jgi:DNA repair protein RecO (recombination protein O)
MQWSDEGIVLAARRHGETSAVASLLTRGHGRHAGLVRGGAGRTARGMLQPGNRVEALWRGRLAEHLGSYTLELGKAQGAALLDDADRLACLASACGVVEQALPERHPYPAIFDAFCALLDALSAANTVWPAVYVRWELGLLEQIGFGLDLAQCAVTGTAEELIYVSPKSGRAVSAAAGTAYKSRLLALPAFLVGNGAAGADDIVAGLTLTGHFLERHLLAHEAAGIAPARERFLHRMARKTTRSGGITAV